MSTTEISAVRPQSKVTQFVTSSRKMLIGGKWTDSVSGKTFATYDEAAAYIVSDNALPERQYPIEYASILKVSVEGVDTVVTDGWQFDIRGFVIGRPE